MPGHSILWPAEPNLLEKPLLPGYREPAQIQAASTLPSAGVALTIFYADGVSVVLLADKRRSVCESILTFNCRVYYKPPQSGSDSNHGNAGPNSKGADLGQECCLVCCRHGVIWELYYTYSPSLMAVHCAVFRPGCTNLRLASAACGSNAKRSRVPAEVCNCSSDEGGRSPGPEHRCRNCRQDCQPCLRRPATACRGGNHRQVTAPFLDAD